MTDKELNETTKKFEEIFDLAQALQDKILELGEIIARNK
jgi:hypothetical protein